jgi:protein-S-isoprenylcysteine O-methyltransferase Ste14
MTNPPISPTQTSGVVIRPPLLFLGAILAGFGMDHLLPISLALPTEGAFVHRLIPGTLVLLGFALFIAGMRNFSRAGTPVPTNQPTSALVTTGVHAWTRNPIYLGMLILYLGIGVAVRSPWMLALIVPVIVTLRYGVIAREERYLAAQFGDEYQGYKARVRRWI